MNASVEANGVLIKVRNSEANPLAGSPALNGAEVLRVSRSGGAMRFGNGETETWLRIDAKPEHPWDQAHAQLGAKFAADGEVTSAEPDLTFAWQAAAAGTGAARPQDGAGGRAKCDKGFGWHLLDEFSGLKSARASLKDADLAQVLIAHLDTGYDPEHPSRPLHIETDRERNFTEEGQSTSARDVTPEGAPFTNRGHGTATLALLAGRDPGTHPGGFGGPIGGAAGCRVLPIRIGDGVVRLRTSTMVMGLDYARAQQADVISMSMGGFTSDAVAQAVNDCYDAGVVMVTAAGNHIGPSPRSIVYPARHRRVIAATGVMADGSAYDGLPFDVMAGCHGPDSNMDYALGAWTPNTFWARIGAPGIIDEDGEGTSAATPQVAAAAALWIAKYRGQMSYPEPWMRGEAVRQALFRSARATSARLDAAAMRKSVGRGTLNALAALGGAPLAAHQLVKAPVADASHYMLNLLFGTGSGVAELAAPARARMLALEMTQIAQRDLAVDDWVLAHDADARAASDRRDLFALIRDSHFASDTLRRALASALSGGALPPIGRAAKASQGKPKRPQTKGASYAPPVPKTRRLQIFALDPSLGVSLATYESKVATVDVVYEADAQGNSLLRPGPVGEYVEVVDIDPASDRFYPPVDLDHPHLLLSDGLAPSEGSPQFHQQMVYAVAMRTIGAFEEALGRKAIWASRTLREPGKPDRPTFIPRLRIYPHALRAENAYYSPEKLSLLFGYFPSSGGNASSSPGGTLVYTALSADVVAHETTHALLDGYTPGYREASNPDVGAFHEAFADVVALLQHFQYEDLVRREMLATKGVLGAASLLGGLAKQFGEGTGKRGALRDYLTTNPEFSYARTFSVHDRGSILVRTIYLVLLAIFERRAADLILLATDGSGVLRSGAIRPELADRLAREATRTARDILRMCIRALDYCPPVDIMFGTFLRAIVTADLEMVDSERLAYRTAFLEQFRAADLLPTNLRTASVDTLRWTPPDPGEASAPWLTKAVEALKIDWRERLPREAIHKKIVQRCEAFKKVLQAEIITDPKICGKLGLENKLPDVAEDGTVLHRLQGTALKVQTVRVARRHLQDGGTQEDIIVVLTQRKWVQIDGVAPFMFHGGSTLVIDPGHLPDRPPKIRYAVIKRTDSPSRLEREVQFRTNPAAGASQALYFGDAWEGGEPFAALHALDAEVE